MRKITRPGQAAIASSTKDDVIDVEGGETSAFPRAAGGLRKLFQIPAANGDEPAAETGNGAKNGAATSSGTTATTKGAATKGATTKGSSSKGSSAKGATSSSSAASSSGSGTNSGARRRNNKKRKRR
jgi:hypothetical protein